MSSSSSMQGDFAALVGRSLEILQREHAAAYRALCACLRGQCFALTIDHERFSLLESGGAIRLADPGEGLTVHLQTRREVLLQLIDGRTSMLEAVLHERMLLRGDISALGRFHQGLHAYLHGAIRCPSFPALLQVLRQPGAAPAITSDTPRRS